MTSISQKIFRSLLVMLLVFSMLCITACDNGEKSVSSSPSDSSSVNGNKENSDTSSNTSSNESSNSDASSSPKLDTLGGELSMETTVKISEGEVAEEVPFPRDVDIINANTGTPKTGASDALTMSRREEILNTPNSNFTPTGDGKTYYVSSKNGSDNNDGLSPETPLRSISTLIPEPGSVILFERGSVFRLGSLMVLKSGITYSAYGEGEKPAFYGSPYNYASKELWQPSRKKNVWYATFGDTDCSSVVFNHGESIGVRKTEGINQLEKNGDFFHNPTLTTVYLYCDKGNPGEVYDDIEICLGTSALKISKGANIVIDNLSIKYACYGISITSGSNITVTNCEIGYIGGGATSGGIRRGNGIEFWDGAAGKNVVKNNWIYQCFDTGITWQGTSGNNYDCEFIDNVIEYCCCSVEFFEGSKVTNPDNESVVNFICNNNISRFSGFGWGNRSFDGGVRGIEGHLRGRLDLLKTLYAEFKNNIFDQAWYKSINITAIYDEDDADPLATRKIIFDGNSYYESSQHASSVSTHATYDSLEKNEAGNYITKSFIFTSQQSLEEMVAFIGDKNPKVVKFLG